MKVPISQHRPNHQLPDQGFRILVIEDDEQIAQLIILALKQIQLSADHAANREEALALVQQNNYQLALLDIHLGNDNGLDLLEIIRLHLPSIEFITMTGDNPRTVETKVRELKVLYHLVKPFSIRELNQLLEHIVHRHTTLPQENSSSVYI
ncbi:response regulator [Desulfopila sp. IMCC35008]|uniref:response regulator n=1 Tax=Desulfopila sp. IMCC35008 TaxID=2653858 RepID=UPI0013D66A08|nr:response regulator [Desulfopila sp. IMCC35008]